MLHLAEHIANKSHVLWDWNGTLLDDVALCVEIISEMALRHGLDDVTHEDYLARFRFPVAEYYREIGFDFAQTSFLELGQHFQTSYHHNVHRTKLHHGAFELLGELTRQGICNCILSASHQKDLETMLERFGLTPFIAHAYGLSDRQAASKVERGLELMRMLGVPREKLILIGDTDHDLEVGEALAIDVLLIAGGHQNDARLKARHSRVISR